MNKKISIKLSDGEFLVSKTENGFQWLLIFQDKEIEPCEIIVDAYKRVGYEDVTFKKEHQMGDKDE